MGKASERVTDMEPLGEGSQKGLRYTEIPRERLQERVTDTKIPRERSLKGFIYTEIPRERLLERVTDMVIPKERLQKEFTDMKIPRERLQKKFTDMEIPGFREFTDTEITWETLQKSGLKKGLVSHQGFHSTPEGALCKQREAYTHVGGFLVVGLMTPPQSEGQGHGQSTVILLHFLG